MLDEKGEGARRERGEKRMNALERTPKAALKQAEGEGELSEGPPGGSYREEGEKKLGKEGGEGNLGCTNHFPVHEAGREGVVDTRGEWEKWEGGKGVMFSLYTVRGAQWRNVVR